MTCHYCAGTGNAPEPPSLESVHRYAKSYGRPELAQPFFDARSECGWCKQGQRIHDWAASFRVFVRNWDANMSNRRQPQRQSIDDQMADNEILIEELRRGKHSGD